MEIKSLRILFFLFLVGIGINSCKTGTGNFTLSGTITDESFSAPMQGATVELYKIPVGTMSQQLVGTTTLGADGKYSFTFPREKMEKYVLKVNKTLYFSIDTTIFYSELTVGKTTTRNYSTSAMSWAKIRLKNDNPQTGDALRYLKQQGMQGCSSCCPSAETNFYGPIDTTFYCINKGNSTYSFYYWVLGTSNNGQKSAITTAFDTTLIQLNY